MVLTRRLLDYLFILLGVVVLTLLLLPFRSAFTIANVTMIFLLMAIVVAVTRGTLPGLWTAFISFMAINFFFVQPEYTLWVADPREVFDLIVFLAAGAVAVRLGAHARQQTETARLRVHEQAVLYRLTRTFNQLATREDVLNALMEIVREEFAARQVDVLPDAAEAAPSDLAVHYLLLQAGETVYATMRAAFDKPLPQPRIDLLNTGVAQAAMALQRIDLSERARKSRQYEEADNLKTALLHAVSHDLRTPITIIKTSASNLRRLGDALPQTERQEIAETIETEADQLDRLVGNLLDMSRLRAGVLRLSSSLNSLEEVAGDVAARVWQVTKQERIKIAFPDDMPLVEFDYGLLMQALTNLVDNSLRYEPPASLVEIRGDWHAGEALLKVVNHGETIPDDVKAHMMEPFYHGRDGHIGLGLPIARGIIEAHHGALRVEDTPGGGATFVIMLPYKEEARVEAENPGG